MNRWLAIIPFVVALVCGISLATWVTRDDGAHELESDLPLHPGQRGFNNVTTVISGTTYVCTSPCVTETLQTDGQQRDTVRATGLIDEALATLRSTTISGKKYCLAMAGCRGTGYTYRGGAWHTAGGKMTLATILSPSTTLYASADTHLMLTTISGATYFANPGKYAGGYWDLALRAYAQERAYLVANPLKRGPTISVR